MSTSIGYATLDVIPSFKGLQRELDNGTAGPLKASGVKGGALFGDNAGKAAGGRFGSVFSKAAKASMLGLAAAGAAAFKFGGDALEEAREAQKVGAQTDAVIKSTGKAAKVTARDIGRLTGRLSDMAGVDDELIQSGANTLLTFTNIRNEVGKGNKIFDRATLAALNMSTALGSDLNGASIQLGKALNDPVKGVTALGRAGVQFSEDQKKAIKAMVESGDTLGAQKVILKELDTQFRGSARAQATESDKLKVAFGNLQEEVGTALIPMMDDFAVFLRKKGIPAARDAAGWIRDDFAPAVKNAAEDVKPLIKNAKDLAKFLDDLPSEARLAGIASLFGGGAALKLRGGRSGALGTVGSALGVAKGTPVYVTNWAQINGGDGLGGGSGPAGIGKKIGASFAITAGPALVAYLSQKGLEDAGKLPRSVANNRVSVGSPFGGVHGQMNFPDIMNVKELEEFQKQAAGRIEGLTAKAEAFRETLFLAGSAKVEPRFGTPGLREANDALAAFIGKQIEAGRPVTPYINTTSIERALALLRTMNAEIRADALPSRGVDNGTTYQHGGTGTSQRAGVNFNGPMTVVAQNPQEMLNYLERKAQQAGLGGRP